MRRGPRVAPPLSEKARSWVSGVVIAMVTLLALDLAFPPPLERLANVSPVVVDREGQWLMAFTTCDVATRQRTHRCDGKWRLAAQLGEVDP